MAETCNFDKDNFHNRKDDKLIVHIPPSQVIGKDSPAIKPVNHSAYMWILTPRRRSGKSWRDPSSEN